MSSEIISNCRLMGKNIRVSIVGNELRILEKKAFRYRISEVHFLSDIEKYDLVDSKLILFFKDGRLVLEECDNLEGIKSVLDEIMRIREEERRREEAKREIVDKALQDFERIAVFVRDVLPAFLELFNALSNKPDFDVARGKANNIVSLGVKEAEEIVRELEKYNIYTAYNKALNLIKKLYEDLRNQEFLGNEELRILSLKALDLGVLLNKIIAEITSGKEFYEDLERVRKLYEEIVEVKPDIPAHPRVEQVYDFIEDYLEKTREKYREIAYQVAEKIIRTRESSSTSN